MNQLKKKMKKKIEIFKQIYLGINSTIIIKNNVNSIIKFLLNQCNKNVMNKNN